MKDVVWMNDILWGIFLFIFVGVVTYFSIKGLVLVTITLIKDWLEQTKKCEVK